MTKEEILAGLDHEKEVRKKIRLSRGELQTRVDGKFEVTKSVVIDGKRYTRKPSGVSPNDGSLDSFYKKYNEIFSTVPIGELTSDERMVALSQFSTRLTYQHTKGISDEDLGAIWKVTHPDYVDDANRFMGKGFSEHHSLFMAMVMVSARGTFLRDGPGVFDFDGLSDAVEEFVANIDNESKYGTAPFIAQDVKTEAIGKVQLRFPEGFRDQLGLKEMFRKGL